MSWKYYVTKQQFNDETWYAVRELYVDDETRLPYAVSSRPVSIVGESINSLLWQLEAIKRDIESQDLYPDHDKFVEQLEFLPDV